MQYFIIYTSLVKIIYDNASFVILLYSLYRYIITNVSFTKSINDDINNNCGWGGIPPCWKIKG